MEAYEIIGRIERLREERGWTIYRLAEEACIAQSTLFNMNTRKTLPSITTLSCLCDAFGITLSEFFSEGAEPERLAQDEKRLIGDYRKLTQKNKRAVCALVNDLK